MTTIRYCATHSRNNISLTARRPDGAAETLFILPREVAGCLFCREQKLLYAPDSHSGFITLFDATERPEHNISDMLMAIDQALAEETQPHDAGKRGNSILWQLRPSGRWMLLAMFVIMLLLIILAEIIVLSRDNTGPLPPPPFTTSSHQTDAGTVQTPLSVTPSPVRETTGTQTHEEPVSPAPLAPVQTASPSDNRAGEARRNLAAVLRRNADRGMFTITLSSGHERTLWAFLDPDCINCRLIEPALQRLTADFNVVVYPVSVIGGEASAARTAPLLCEKDPQKRAAGWQRLYSADSGMTTPDHNTAPAAGDECLRAARAAIDVNNVAFRQFGFAGTPWVLSDTGWHLPTGILQDAGTVNLFLKTTDSENVRP